MKDKKAQLVDSNPCGICRSMGLPVCPGHRRAGKGSQGSSSGESMPGAKGPELTPFNFKKIIEALLNHANWRLVEDTDLTFIFNDVDALFSLVLDMEKGLLSFQSNRELSKEEQKDLNGLFDAIERELMLFKLELAENNLQAGPIKVARGANSLSIKIPVPQYYDAFVQRLMDKNLLPNKLSSNNELKQPASPAVEPENNKSTAPTSFNMQLRPKDWDIDR